LERITNSQVHLVFGRDVSQVSAGKFPIRSPLPSPQLDNEGVRTPHERSRPQSLDPVAIL